MKTKDFNITTKKNRKATLRTIYLDGELSLKNTVSIWRKLKSIKRDVDSYELILQQVETLDLAMIQQLYAFKKQVEKEGASCCMKATLDREQMAMISRAGFPGLPGK